MRLCRTCRVYKAPEEFRTRARSCKVCVDSRTTNKFERWYGLEDDKKTKEALKSRQWYEEHKNSQDFKSRRAEYWRLNREKLAEGQRRRQRAFKILVMQHYGEGECACCAETLLDFLTIDHINNDGAEDRKKRKAKTGKYFYKWLVDNGFPPGFQVLCMNCNLSKHLNGGSCIHQTLSLNAEVS